MARLYAAGTHGGTNPNPLVSRVLLTGDSVKIVISDASLVLLQHYLGRRLSLNDYLQGDYPRALLASKGDPGAADVLERAALAGYGTYADIGPATRLLQFGQTYRPKAAVIRHPRQLNIHDFESGSFVLLGGPLADPWYSLFEPHLNFVFEVEYGTGGVWIRNKVPQASEAPVYAPGKNSNSDFAVIAVLPNLRRTGRILLLAGTSVSGTAAATEMVLNDRLSPELLRIFRQSKNEDDTIEVLLRTSVMAGVPVGSKIEAYRIHNP
jgi:hypothetical protein